MTSSATYAFAPDNGDFLEEAFERCLIDPATLGVRHFTSAVRSANLLFSYWATKGAKLLQVDEQTQTLTVDTPSYTPASGTIVILGGIIRRSGKDTPVSPITRDQYQLIPDKTANGLPTQVWYDRGANLYYMWQEPENSTDVFRYRRIRRIQDFGTGVQTPDLPLWWWDAFAAGMAWRLSEKFAPQLYADKKAIADQMLAEAMREDRERADTSFSISI